MRDKDGSSIGVMGMEFGGKASSRMNVRIGSLGLALLATTAIHMSGAAVPAAQAQQAAINYSVPAGPLGTAISRFGDRSNLQVLYRADLVRGKSSPGVSGSMTPGEALNRLLAGTGLSYSFTNANTVTITDRVATAHDAPVDADGSLVLDTITISGRGGSGAFTPDTPYETAGSSSHISQEDIERFRGTSTGDMFRGVPGVMAGNNRGSSALDLNIRGLQGMNRIATTVDGTQQTTSGGRAYNGPDSRTYVDPDLIGGVEVQKGPGFGALGAGAIGGVVNLRTLNADDIVQEGKQFGARLRGGTTSANVQPRISDSPLQNRTVPYDSPPDLFSFDNGFGSVALATKQDSFDFLAAFAARKRGNYFAGNSGTKSPRSPVEPGQEVFNTSEDSTTALVKGVLRPLDGHSLELSYMRYENDFGEISPLFTYLYPNSYSQRALSHAEVHTWSARYNWDPSDNDLLNLNLNVFYTDMYSLWASSSSFSDTLMPISSNNTGINITNTSVIDTPYGNFDLSYGAAYTVEKRNAENNLDNLLSRAIIGDRELGSVFAKGNWAVTDWLTLSGGLRYDEYTTTGTAGYTASTSVFSGNRVSPSLGVTIAPWEGVQFYGVYSEGVRPLSLQESKAAVYLQNDPLRPEVSYNWEIGTNVLRDDLFLVGDKFRTKIGYFNNVVDDYIAGSQGYGYINTNAKFSGIEASVKYDTRTIFADFAFNYYINAEICAECNVSIPMLPEFSMFHIPPKYNTSITIGAHLYGGDLTVGTKITHASKRAFYWPRQVRGFLDNPYTTVDLFGTYKFNESSSLDIVVENIFDKYYFDSLTEATNPAPGRTIRAAFTAKF